MIVSQGGVCAICHETLVLYHTDHCHKTGQVRGILCNLCNMMLGKAKDNVETLQNAITYLNSAAEKQQSKERTNATR